MRPFRFAKYLPGYGIRPIILTPDENFYQRMHPDIKREDSLLKELSNDVNIHHVSMDERILKRQSKLRLYFRVLDPYKKRWENNLYAKIDEIIKVYDIKAIYATAPPFSMAPLAVKISKRYKLPIFLDMRDEWTLWGATGFATYAHYYLTYRIEKKCFKNATKIISVTDQVINDFKKTHSELPASKFVTISNGFNFNSYRFEDIVKTPINDKYKIGYLGSFYYSPVARKVIFDKWWKKKRHRMLQYVPRKEDYLYRSPYFFFKTLNYLFVERPDLKKKIEINFVGDKYDWLKDMIEEFNLSSNCVLHGKVSYKTSLEIAGNFDALLSTSIKVINGEDYALASKTFDYLFLRKPILAFVTKGAQKEFLEKSGVAIIFDPDNIPDSSKKLEEFFSQNMIFKPNKEFLENFNGNRLTQKLADLIKTNINH